MFQDSTPRFYVMRTIADGWHAVISDLGVVIIGGAIFWTSAMASIVTVLGFFLFFPVLVYGGYRMLLNLQDGIAGYTDLGDGFPRYWAALGDTLALMFFQTLLFVPWWILIAISSLVETRSLAGLLNLLGLVLSIGLVPRFVFAPFYLVEQHAGPLEAMKRSWAVTAEQKLSVVLLVFASIMIAGLGAITGIGVLISVPMSWVMFASAFRQMYPRQKPPTVK